MKAYTRRRLLASAKLGLAAMPLFVALSLAQGLALVPGMFLFSFVAGFAVGVAELFVLRDWMKGYGFVPHLVAKSVVLVAVMYAAFALLNLLDVVAGISWAQYLDAVLSRGVLVAILQTFLIVTFLLFFVHLDRLLGPGVLLGYVTGRYHSPRREDRVFLFIDLKGSTALADSMPADRYYAFLHRYFSEMAEPVLATDAEIYQYVGDEVVLTWPVARGIQEANCLRVFFQILDQIEAHRERFLADFGAVPEFKAGAHCGTVITAQIGELKSEIVYNGDVLNVAARIQAKCNELGRDFLVSDDLARRIGDVDGFVTETLGSVPLRGKQDGVPLVAVERK